MGLRMGSVSCQLSSCTYYQHQVYQILTVCIWRINTTRVQKCYSYLMAGTGARLSLFAVSIKVCC